VGGQEFDPAAAILPSAGHAARCSEPARTRVPGPAGRRGGGTPNLMRLFFHPRGIRPDVVNWAAIARLLWHRAEREAEAEAGEELRQLLAELRPYQDRSLWPEGEEVTLLPVLPLEIARGGVRVSLFSVISTFGTAQDISADELRIESLFPADAATEELLRSGGGKGG